MKSEIWESMPTDKIGSVIWCSGKVVRNLHSYKEKTLLIASLLARLYGRDCVEIEDMEAAEKIKNLECV